MDLAALSAQLERIFEDTAGYQLSHNDRRRLGIDDRSFVYGEISERHFLEALARTDPRAGEVFYDLGSGTGRAVIAAAAGYPFGKVVGIEKLESLVQAAKVAAKKLAERGLQRAPIELREQDLLTADFSDADVVFAHSTCFQPSLLEPLGRACERLKPGSRVLCFGHPLENPALERIESFEVETGWGSSAGTLLRRR